MKPNNSSAGRVYDPVFIFMVIAVILAVGSSFALRSVSPTMGPSAAQGSEGEFSLPAPDSDSGAAPVHAAVKSHAN
jgi:hypothetical protein